MVQASPLFGTPQTLTFGLANLPSSTGLGTGRQSAVIDVKDLPFASGGQALEIHVGGTVVLGTSPTANRTILIGLFATWDDSVFTGGLGGGDGAATPDDLSLLVILEAINTAGTTGKTYRWGPHCVAGRHRFGGILPAQVGLYLSHDTGVNLAGSGHSTLWTPYRTQSA